MAQLKPFEKLSRPALGWVKTLRKALGMTSQQLAGRCGVSKTRILRLEQDEILGRTTLASLEKVANKMGCRLVYAFVPEKDILNVIEEKAQEKALEILSRISHSMEMEDQAIGKTANLEQLELLKEKLLRENIKSLWD
jgi:predicted DNA-binding mobile mystery protein A